MPINPLSISASRETTDGPTSTSTKPGTISSMSGTANVTGRERTRDKLHPNLGVKVLHAGENGAHRRSPRKVSPGHPSEKFAQEPATSDQGASHAFLPAATKHPGHFDAQLGMGRLEGHHQRAGKGPAAGNHRT